MAQHTSKVIRTLPKFGELRGSVDGWDFKNYVLGAMFCRYISENLTEYINAGEIAAGTTGFDYAKLPDGEAEETWEGLA